MDTTPRSSWLRAAIEALPMPGSPGVASDFKAEPGRAPRLLHLNESPFPPSPRAIEAARLCASELHRYPDPMATALTAAVSRRTGVPEGRIVFGSGSEDLIRILIDVSCDRADHVLVPAPSFPLFANAARLAEAVPVRIALAKDGSNDAGAMLDAAGPRTRLAFCCTPNPPNGAPTSLGEVQRLAQLLPAHVMLVVDEAYGEFAVHAGLPRYLPALEQRSGPWVVLRTFSKAYGLAGLRIGYAICDSVATANALRKGRLAYSPNAVAQAAALAALDDEAYLGAVLDAIARERQRLDAGLRTLALSPYPSVTNFVSVELPFPAAECAAELRKRSILVRDWRDPDYPNHLRISVGRADDTDALLIALQDVLSGARGQGRPVEATHANLEVKA